MLGLLVFYMLPPVFTSENDTDTTPGNEEGETKWTSLDSVSRHGRSVTLPEVVVKGQKHKLLHILAYMRECSTLESYTDTIFLFREKMVDFMWPLDSKANLRGWSRPRVLAVRSYVRYTDATGLDSVSDATRHHFSWSDWVGLPPSMKIPRKNVDGNTHGEALNGSHAPAERWAISGDEVSVTVDVMADTLCRRWMPGLKGFFRRDVDFEKLEFSCRFGNVISDQVAPPDIEMYSYRIHSNGRARDMFRFNRKDEPFFVTTEAQVYIIDHEYLSKREARKYEEGKFGEDLKVIMVPAGAPELPYGIEDLVNRVESMDKDSLRLQSNPDPLLKGRLKHRKQGFGAKVLKSLKKRIGI